VGRLSIILGHSEISTTLKYLHLLAEDFKTASESVDLNRFR
jgi:site-specific recombinase XerD